MFFSCLPAATQKRKPITSQANKDMAYKLLTPSTIVFGLAAYDLNNLKGAHMRGIYCESLLTSPIASTRFFRGAQPEPRSRTQTRLQAYPPLRYYPLLTGYFCGFAVGYGLGELCDWRGMGLALGGAYWLIEVDLNYQSEKFGYS